MEIVLLRISYYSWWFPHVDGFEAGWRLWEEKEIVLAHLLVICEGFLCFPRWSAKSNSSGLLMLLQHLTIGRFWWRLLIGSMCDTD
jgi:hypothetical protein